MGRKTVTPQRGKAKIMIKQLDLHDYKQIVAALRTGANIPYIGDLLYCAQYKGKVYSKGRPRVTKTGHAFTPANTRKFEKSVAELYENTDAPLVFCPLYIELLLHDKPAKKIDVATQAMMGRGYAFSTIGDIDNRAKSILDAGNGILFKDDAQISRLHVSRHYGPDEGFSIIVKRSGFSKNEIENIKSVSGGKL